MDQAEYYRSWRIKELDGTPCVPAEAGKSIRIAAGGINLLETDGQYNEAFKYSLDSYFKSGKVCMWRIDKTSEAKEWILNLDDEAREAILARLIGGDKRGANRF